MSYMLSISCSPYIKHERESVHCIAYTDSAPRNGVFFDEHQGVWQCDETLSRVRDIILENMIS